MASDTALLDELIGRLRHGDEDALASLFSMFRPRLKQMVTFRMDRRLSGRVDPSDVLQEAYLDALHRVEHYFKGPQNSFLLWLRQITEQRMIDIHRRHLGSQMRDVRREISLDRNIGSPATSACMVAQLVGQISSPSERAVRGEVEARLEEILNSLDPIDREVLALRHFEELGNNDVAELLGLQASAASNRYFRALKRLRERLQDVPGLDEELGFA